MTPERYREIRISAEAAGREHAETAIARVADWASARGPGATQAPSGVVAEERETWLYFAEGAADVTWEAACEAHGCAASSPDGWQVEAKAREANDAKADRKVWRGAATTRRYQPSVWGQHRKGSRA